MKSSYVGGCQTTVIENGALKKSSFKVKVAIAPEKLAAGGTQTATINAKLDEQNRASTIVVWESLAPITASARRVSFGLVKRGMRQVRAFSLKSSDGQSFRIVGCATDSSLVRVSAPPPDTSAPIHELHVEFEGALEARTVETGCLSFEVDHPLMRNVTVDWSAILINST